VVDTGYRTDLVLLSDKGIAVFWMENAEWAANDDGLTRATLDVALGYTPEPIHTRRSIEYALSSYPRSGINAALKQYQTIRKSRQADLYTFDENGLNGFGQYLIRLGRLPDARSNSTEFC
jgi:hypothetical protein